MHLNEKIGNKFITYICNNQNLRDCLFSRDKEELPDCPVPLSAVSTQVCPCERTASGKHGQYIMDGQKKKSVALTKNIMYMYIDHHLRNTSMVIVSLLHHSCERPCPVLHFGQRVIHVHVI